LIDPDDLIISYTENGVVYDQKTYVLKSSNIIEITVMPTGGEESNSAEIGVISYSCDEIEIDVFGLRGKLTRK
jgi:hypothetical protein